MSSSGSDIDFAAVGTTHSPASDIELAGDVVQTADSDIEFACGVQADSDIEFAAAPAHSPTTPTPARVVRRRRRVRKVKTSGVFWAYVVNKQEDNQDFIICLIQVEWRLLGPNIAAGHVYNCGTLDYRATRVHMFDERSAALPVDFLVESPLAPVRVREICGGVALYGIPFTVDTFLRSEKICVDCVLRFDDPATVEEFMCDQGDIPLGTFPIHKWRPLDSRALPEHPHKAIVKRWRAVQRDAYKEAGHVSVASAAPAATAAGVDFLTYLPPWIDLQQLDVGTRSQTRLAQEVDPVRLINALAICSHLKTPRAFSEVIDDVVEYLTPDNAADHPVPGTIARQKELDPQRTTLMIALARSDVVAMNLARRLFRKWRVNDEIKSIHIYSDASPVVGHELQGMIIDIVLKRGDVIRMTLPGSTLAYGHADALSKGVALLHALWLVAGLSEADLAYCCGCVRSLTTDFGVEMHLLEMPDVAAAYVAFMGGAPTHRLRPLVKQGSRLFHKALRMAGWSHTH